MIDKEKGKNKITDKKEKFKSFIESKISSLMNRQISPSNIFNFYDDFLNGLVDISDEVLNKYIKETRVPNKTDREKGLQEDEAFKYFNINSIGETIDSMSEIVEKREERLKEMTDEISERSQIDRKVFVPPDREDKFLVTPGNGGWKEREYIPRLLTLVYILENDLDLKLKDSQDITINQGINDKEMMRKESYIRVSIPELNRIVYICNEEGNASFVFDRKIVKENNLSALDLDDYSKINFNELIENNKNVGVKINQSKFWRERMLTALTKNISEFEKQKSEVKSDLENKENIPLKKEGWENKFSLTKYIKKTPEKIQIFAESYRKDHPEWFEKQIEKMGRVPEFYGPELVKIIIDHFNLVSTKKTGWENASSASELVFGHIGSHNKIKEFVEPYRKDHPEWFEKQRSGKKTVEHYGPELVKIMIEHFKNIEKVWKSPGALSIIIFGYLTKSAHIKIKEFAEQYRKDHPEWFSNQESRKSGSHEYYHSDLIKIITEHFEKEVNFLRNLSQKQEGEESANTLSKYLHVRPGKIKKFVELYRSDHPEWFVERKSRTSLPVECYKPELVKLIKEHFSKNKE
jgi:predicted HTH domain antitoxin